LIFSIGHPVETGDDPVLLVGDQDIVCRKSSGLTHLCCGGIERACGFSLQKKIVEHALGVYSLHHEKSLYINIATRISKDCDCMGHSFKKIAPDVGILISRDPVAVDAASLDLVEERTGKTIPQMAYDIPYRVQLEYAKELGFGSPGYSLITV